MINYLANFNTNGAAFPATAAINVSVPGAGDGTEFKALLVNDAWGARQAIMNYAGLTPNAASETYSNSQFLTAITRSLSPAGMVFMSHTQQDPATLGYRFLELNGQGIVRANYPDLDAACYVGAARNPTAQYYYRANDSGGSSRSTTGAYLILPDMRGAFARGYDPTATRDPDGVTRGFPDSQAHAFEDHAHQCVTNEYPVLYAERSGLKTTGAEPCFEPTVSISGYGLDLIAGGYSYIISGNWEVETRPVNVQVKFWVRY